MTLNFVNQSPQELTESGRQPVSMSVDDADAGRVIVVVSGRW